MISRGFVAVSGGGVGADRESSAPQEDDYEFPRVLFLMHPWFVLSKEFAEIFIDLYPFRQLVDTRTECCADA